eukprot:scaffold135465_cov33-Prasinocladus_malaysianus.AAC.1
MQSPISVPVMYCLMGLLRSQILCECPQFASAEMWSKMLGGLMELLERADNDGDGESSASAMATGFELLRFPGTHACEIHWCILVFGQGTPMTRTNTVAIRRPSLSCITPEQCRRTPCLRCGCLLSWLCRGWCRSPLNSNRAREFLRADLHAVRSAFVKPPICVCVRIPSPHFTVQYFRYTEYTRVGFEYALV